MANGYKDAILAMGPKTFITFDNDNYFDPVSKELFFPFVNDDSSNGNIGVVNIVDDQGGGQDSGYGAGMISLVEREQYPQQSFVFGWRGFNSWYNLDQATYPYVPYVKAYVSIDSSACKFDLDGGSPRSGSFSVAFHYYKDQSESDAGGNQTTGWATGPGTSTPIFVWEGILYVTLHENYPDWAGQTPLDIYFSPGTGQFDKWISSQGTYKNVTGDGAALTQFINPVQGDAPGYGTTNTFKDSKFVVITWNADVQSKKGTFCVYVDGELMCSHKLENFHNDQITHNTKNLPWYIGGYPHVYTYDEIPYIAGIETPTSRASNYGAAAPNAPNANDFPDRAKTAMRVDQVAVFDYALSGPQVGYLWMKNRFQVDVIARLQPRAYFPMNEAHQAGITTMYSYTDSNNVNTPDFYPMYTNGDVTMGFPGPSQIPNSKSYFFNGGTASADFEIPAGDFSIETWVKFSGTDRAVLMSWAGVDHPYWGGATIQVNWQEDVAVPGAVQFNIDAVSHISSRPGLNIADGQWHHIVAIRRKASIELWIDAQKQGAIHNLTWNSSISKIYSGMHLMNHQDGLLPLVGYMSNFAIYNYALPGRSVRQHYYWKVVYRIRGTTVELGSPEPTDVRLIRHSDGSLVTRLTSDPVEGQFEFNPNISTYYDLFAIEQNFFPTHARAFGPLVPTTVPDTAPYRRFNDSDYFNPGSDGFGNN